MSGIRVLLADDHAIVRSGIRNAVEELDELEVVGEAKDGPTLFTSLQTLHPDLLLIDVTMPEFDPIPAIRQIRHDYPELKILVISAYDDDIYVQGLLKAGVNGYHLKDQPLQDLRLALQRVLNGEKWISSSIVDRLVNLDPTTPTSPPLTSRQRDILHLLQKGNSNQSIALQLNLSVKTIENHLTRLYRLLGVQSRLEAVNIIRDNPDILAISGQVAAEMPVHQTPLTKRLSVVLVDDNPRYRQQLQRTIGKIYPSANIYEADNIQSAVDLAKSGSFHLFLIDVLLGDQNGIQCALQVKAFAPQSRIILISAYPDKEFRRQSLDIGASAFIDKKVLDSATLNHILEDVVQSNLQAQ
ncbi:MAG: DNA-binding response regulator [Chloroflexi bacterium]|nr:MAG: DNA-binding response regulator [Chloroflexota bacterium]MBL1196458.1 DNA-binding response regulator [Chloroflexota bacterium]NOH13753.1 response regulator [Chloroflexota bacterium]